MTAKYHARNIILRYLPRIWCIIRSQTIGRIGQRIARHILEPGSVTALGNGGAIFVASTAATAGIIAPQQLRRWRLITAAAAACQRCCCVWLQYGDDGQTEDGNSKGLSLEMGPVRCRTVLHKVWAWRKWTQKISRRQEREHMRNVSALEIPCWEGDAMFVQCFRYTTEWRRVDDGAVTVTADDDDAYMKIFHSLITCPMYICVVFYAQTVFFVVLFI